MKSGPPYRADAIANEFLDGRFGQITPMKLQKLVYYAHAWHLALFDDSPLIKDRIEAWKYGPVIPTLYSEFREFGDNPITRFAIELDWDSMELVPDRIQDDDAKTRKLVEKIWDRLGGLTAIQLSSMTHQPNEPWFKVRKPRPGIEIPNQLIAKDFRAMLKKPAKGV